MSTIAKNHKPTILLGAGAALEIGAPSTDKITQEVIKPNNYINPLARNVFNEQAYFTVLSKVYNQLKEKYQRSPNFEQLFFVIEMLESYNMAWTHDCKSSIRYPVLAPFIVPMTGIVSHNEWDNLSSLISQCQTHIMCRINTYDSQFKDKQKTEYQWYQQFWNEFDSFDLFNLNYDTTIEQSLEDYNDGFIASDDSRFQKFEPRALYNGESKHKICHLHGCILYYYQKFKDINHDVYEYKHEDMYKWSDFSTVISMIKRTSGSSPLTQSGEISHIGSIITGLRKAEKLTVIPYNYYHHYLNSAILNNKSLLIVGYSFGDLYINDLIERMNLLYNNDKRIVIITRWKYTQIKENNGTITKTYREEEWNTYNEFMFIKKMMHTDSFEMRCLDKTIKDESSYTSQEGDVKLFVYGLKSAVNKHSKEIIDFITK